MHDVLQRGTAREPGNHRLLSLPRICHLTCVALVLAELTTGCCSVGSRSPSPTILMETDAAFARAATVQGVAAAFRDYAAPTATVFPQGGQPVTGPEGIFRLMLEGQGQLTWAPRGAELSASRDFGYTWGEYQFRPAGADGTGSVHYGKYLTVWRRQPDGKWKFVADIGNPSPPPAP